jgi:hypothetical protein
MAPDDHEKIRNCFNCLDTHSNEILLSRNRTSQSFGKYAMIKPCWILLGEILIDLSSATK